MNFSMGVLLLVSRLLYHLIASWFVRFLMVGVLLNLRMILLDNLGRFRTYLRYFVCIISHSDSMLSEVVMMAE